MLPEPQSSGWVRQPVQPDDEGSLRDFLASLLRHLPLAIWCAVLGSVLGLVLALAGGRQYVAKASFRPHETSEAPSQYAAIAAQFGLGGLANFGGEPLAFYEQLVRSRAALSDVLADTYEPPAREAGRAQPIQLLDLYADPDAGNRVLAGVESLRQTISVRRLDDAGMIEFEVQAEEPDLAEHIASRLLDWLTQFNLVQRQSQARAEREFVQARLQEQARALQATQDSLKFFLERNRQFDSAPELRFENDRLQRAVALNEQLYTSLAQAFQQARIDEVRNTPVLTVIDRPENSAIAKGGVMLIVVMASTLGGVLGLIAGMVGEQIRQERTRDPALNAELTELRQSLLTRTLHGPGTLYRRVRRRLRR